MVASDPISESRCAADPAEAFVQLDARRDRRDPSSSMSLVTAASPADRTGSHAAPTGSSARKLTSGTRMVLDGHHPQAVGELPPADVGELERRLGTE